MGKGKGGKGERVKGAEPEEGERQERSSREQAMPSGRSEYTRSDGKDVRVEKKEGKERSKMGREK